MSIYGPWGVGVINRLVYQFERTERLFRSRKFQGFGGLSRIPHPDAIPFLIKKLGFKNQFVVEATARDLRLVTAQDFGTDAAAWQRWFGVHRNEKQEEWVLARLEAEGYPVTRFSGAARIPILLEALKDQSEEIRLHAYLLFRTLAPNSARAIRYYPYHGSIGARRRALAKLMSWWRSHRKEYVARNPEVAESQRVARQIAFAHPLQRPEAREDFTPEEWRKWEKDVADRYDMLVKKRRDSWLRRGLETLAMMGLVFLFIIFIVVMVAGMITQEKYVFLLPVFLAICLLSLSLVLSVRAGSKGRIVRAYSLSPDYHRGLMRRRHIQEVLEGRREFSVLQGIGLTCACMITGAIIAGLISATHFWWWENTRYIPVDGVAGMVFGILLSFALSYRARHKERRG